MKFAFFRHITILIVLGVVASYLLLVTLHTDLTRLSECRQKTSEMLHTQSKIQELLLIGQLQPVSPNTAINQSLTRLHGAQAELDTLFAITHSDSEFAPLFERVSESCASEIEMVERLLTLDSAYRNSLAYIEETSARLSEFHDQAEDRTLAWEILLIRSHIASMWSTRSFQKEGAMRLNTQIELIDKRPIDENLREDLHLLQIHAKNASKLEPQMTAQLDAVLHSPLIDALNSVDQALANKISMESGRVQFASRGFATVIVALVAFVISLLWELSQKSHSLQMVNDSLEEKIQLEAKKIRDVEEALYQSRKLESIGVLAAGIAHEINTPMQCVTSNVEYLKRSHEKLLEIVCKFRDQLFDETPTPRSERIDYMQSLIKQGRFEKMCSETSNAIDESADASRRVIEIVRAMKSMVHPGTTTKVEADINTLVESAATISRSHWKPVAELELDLDKDLPPLNCLPAEMNQVLLNLIVNAADAVAENRSHDGPLGKISVSTSQENDGIRIEISDTGIGIPDALKRRVFDQFFTTKDVGKGSGQGLALTHDVVINKHCGRISLDSKVGCGTTITIWLPFAACDTKLVPSN